jgi:hypothetical protein
MKTILWLDDYRDPFTNQWFPRILPQYIDRIDDIVWVKSYDEFTQWIIENGMPYFISFDHDLADEHYAPEEHWNDKYDSWAESQNFKEKTGYECAKWLTEYCMDNEVNMCKWFAHTANLAGRKNIDGLLVSFIKNVNYS